MFLFLKLVLAHMVADFILQFEELYQLKLKSRLGHLAHAFFHGLVSYLLLIPYWDNPTIMAAVLAITVIHYWQDQIKYSIQARHPRQIFWCFTLDQIGHFLFLACILWIPEAHTVRGFENQPSLNFYYRHQTLTLFLILFISVGFKAAYFLHAFRKSFVSGTRPDHFITSFEMIWGMAERTWITFCWLNFSPLYALVSFAPAFARFSYKRMRNSLDFLLSYGYAALSGWLFSFWIKP